MKPELKDFILHLLNDNDEKNKSLIGEQNLAAFINANFEEYLYSNFALLIAVKKIVDPTDNLLDIGKYTQDPEEIANISSAQQAAAVLLFIEHCYSKVNKYTENSDYDVLPYIQVLRFFAEKLQSHPKISETIKTTFPNFYEIITVANLINNPEKNQAADITPTNSEPNLSVQQETSEKNTAIAQIAVEKAADPLISERLENENILDLKNSLEKILRRNTKSFFGLLVNDPSNNKKNPHLFALLEILRKETKFNLEKIQSFCDTILAQQKASNSEEKAVYQQLLVTIFEYLKNLKDSTPNNKQLDETYNAVRSNLYKIQALNSIDAYIDNRKGLFTRYIFNDIYYRAVNTNDTRTPPKDSQRYKTKMLFAFDKDIVKAKTANDYLDIIKRIQIQLKPFYNLNDTTYHNQFSVSKALLHELQHQTLALLRLNFPESTKIIQPAELLVDNAVFARLREELLEYKNNRQDITSNPFGLLKDKLTDTQRTQSFNYTDWLLGNLDVISKKFTTDVEEIASFTHDEKIKLYFQYIEACGYSLKQIRSIDSDLENSINVTQLTVINKLLSELANHPEKNQYYQQLYNVIEYQKPNNDVKRQLKNLFNDFSLPPVKSDLEQKNAFPKRMQERYAAWQELENARRNQFKVEVVMQDLAAYLKKGVAKLAKGKALDTSIFDKLAKGIGVVIPTPEARLSVQAVGVACTVKQTLDPEIVGNKPLESLTEQQKDDFVTYLLARFLETYRQKITMLHFDKSKEGRAALNELAYYAAERILHFLEKTQLEDEDISETNLIESRKKGILPEYISDKFFNKVFTDLQEQPYYHSVIPLKPTKLRLQNEARILINTGRGFDVNDFFLHGPSLTLNEEKQVVKKPDPEMSRHEENKPIAAPKIFFGYSLFWNPPGTSKSTAERKKSAVPAPTAAPSFLR